MTMQWDDDPTHHNLDIKEGRYLWNTDIVESLRKTTKVILI